MDVKLYGPHIGWVMQEVCKQAAKIMMQLIFRVAKERKGTKPDGRTDWVTQADRECQREMVRILREQLLDPFGIGLVAEESDETPLVKCSIPNRNLFFTVDPIDGTSAYTRRQTHGFGPMIALVDSDDVVGACICDANTLDIFYYRPGSTKTHRFRPDTDINELLVPNTAPLMEQYLLLREMPEKHRPFTRPIIAGFPCKGMSVTDGSIGLSMARLWNGEVGACILNQKRVTPWDDAPVIGMCRRLGYDFYRIDKTLEDGVEYPTLVRFNPTVPKMVSGWDSDVLIAHLTHREEIMRAFHISQNGG